MRGSRLHHLRANVAVAVVIVLVVAMVGSAAWAAPLDTYEDSFLTAGFSGNDGSLLWSTDWLELGEADGPNTGLIEVQNDGRCADTICLVLGKNGANSDASVEREADLTGATTAILSFEYRRHLHSIGAGRVDLEVSDNGGTDWYPLDSWLLDTSDPGQIQASYDISTYRSIDTRIRFSVVGSADASHFNVDDLQIALIDDGAALYLVAGAGGGAGGDDLLTAVDPTDLDEASNEVNIGTGTGTMSIKAAAMEPGTDVLFAADGGQLGVLNRATGTFSPSASPVGSGNGAQGSIAFDDIAGLTFDPFTGALYAVQERGFGVEDLLLLIDPVTGAHVPGAFSGDDYTPIQNQGIHYHASDIAIDPTSGQLYGMHWTLSGPSHGLITIDTATGASTVVGPSPDETKGMTFDQSGQLWGTTATGAVESLFMIDKTDGSASQVRTIDNGSNYGAIAASLVSTINSPPVFDQDLLDREDTETMAVAVSAAATDLDVGDVLSYSATGLPPGLTVDPDSGLISGTISLGAAGIYSTEITVTDDGIPVQSDLDTFTWTVSHPPVLGSIGSLGVDEQSPLAFTATATDDDLPGDTLVFSLEGTPPSGAAMAANGDFTWTPTEAQGPGIYPLTVRVTDSVGAFDEEIVPVTVAELNQAPILDAVGPRAVDEEAVLVFTATATDADEPANTLTFSLEGVPPTGASITPGGDFVWTPTEAQGPGSYDITIRVTDDAAPSAWDEEVITVSVAEIDLPPVVTNPGNQTNGEGDVILLPVAASDPDLPADILTWAAVGLPDGLSINPANGEISGTVDPLAATGSPYAVTITVTDDDALWDDATFTWTVVDTNASPTLDPIGPKSVDEGGLLSFVATGSDPDLDDLTFSLQGSPPSGATITTGGLFTWIPTEAQGPGSYSFDVVVTDDGSPSLSDTETITVTVAEVNAPPSISDPGNQTALIGASFSVTLTATDPDGTTPSFTAPTLPGWANITDNGDGSATISGIPATADYGSSGVAVTATDGSLSSTVLFTVTVTGNRPPAFAQDLLDRLSRVDDAISLPAPATDPDGDVLTYSATGLPQGLTINPTTGLVTGAVEATAVGSHTVVLMVNDAGTPSLFDVDTFTWIITAANTAPIISNPGPQIAVEGNPFSLNLTATDADGTIPSFSAQLPGWARLVVNGDGTARIQGTPSADDVGSSVARVTASDGQLSDSITFSITVEPAPVVIEPIPQLEVTEQSPLSYQVSLSRAATEVEFRLAGTWPSGLAIDPGIGVLTWTPTEGQGPDTYELVVELVDLVTGEVLSARPVRIIVLESATAPTIAPIPGIRVDRGSTTQLQVLATDPDLPASPPTYSLAGAVPPGATIDRMTGMFSWEVLEDEAVGAHQLIVRVTDGADNRLFDEATLTVIVEAAAVNARKTDLVEKLTSVPVDLTVDLTPPPASVRRTLTLMGSAGFASVRSVGLPVVFLVLLAAVAVSLGRISLFPLLGRSRRLEGVVIWSDQDSGYGFILPDLEDLQIFFHRQMMKRGHDPPGLGDRVSFRLVRGAERDFALSVMTRKESRKR